MDPKQATLSKTFPIIEVICDDLFELVFEYLDYTSGLNVRCSSTKILQKNSRLMKRKMRLLFWNRFITDDFDLIRENRLGTLYILKRILPKFVDYLLPIKKHRKDRLTQILEKLPISFKTACHLLIDWYEIRNRIEKARPVDRMLRCKFVTIEEVNFESREYIFRISLFLGFKYLCFELFRVITEMHELNNEASRSFLARLIIMLH